MKRSAIFSDCGSFRYQLTRYWAVGLPHGVFIMLNPSTADAKHDDPTVRKCVGFGQRFGWGGFTIVNLYAYRATDPADLRAAGYPIGPANDQFLLKAAFTGAPVVLAWGRKGHQQMNRVRDVLELLRGLPLFALRIAKTGAPSHPLMLPYSTQLFPYHEQKTNSRATGSGVR